MSKVFTTQIIILGISILCVTIFYYWTQQAGSFIFAFLAGCLGGSISLIRRLRSETGVLVQKMASSWIATLMPVLYGGIMAIVTYLLFMSGILTGDSGGGLFTSNLFPNFFRPDLNEGEVISLPVVLKIRPEKVMDVGKLLVWSFLSGYSEKFVMSILGSLEKRSKG